MLPAQFVLSPLLAQLSCGCRALACAVDATQPSPKGLQFAAGRGLSDPSEWGDEQRSFGGTRFCTNNRRPAWTRAIAAAARKKWVCFSSAPHEGTFRVWVEMVARTKVTPKITARSLHACVSPRQKARQLPQRGSNARPGRARGDSQPCGRSPPVLAWKKRLQS